MRTAPLTVSHREKLTARQRTHAHDGYASEYTYSEKCHGQLSSNNPSFFVVIVYNTRTNRPANTRFEFLRSLVGGLGQINFCEVYSGPSWDGAGYRIQITSVKSLSI